MNTFHAEYIETRQERNIYEFQCRCGSIGEIGVPRRSQIAFPHDCGALLIQRLPSGMFATPQLIEVTA